MKMNKFIRSLVTTCIVLAAMTGGVVLGTTAASAHDHTTATFAARCEPSTNRALGTIKLIGREGVKQHYEISVVGRGTVRVGDFPAGGGSTEFDVNLGTAPRGATGVNVELWFVNPNGSLYGYDRDKSGTFPAVASCLATTTTSTTTSTTSTTTAKPTTTIVTTTTSTTAPAVLIPAISVVRPQAQPAKPVRAAKMRFAG